MTDLSHHHTPDCTRRGTDHLCCVGDAERLGLDLALYGSAYTVDGKRVDPTTVVVHQADIRCTCDPGPEGQHCYWCALMAQPILCGPDCEHPSHQPDLVIGATEPEIRTQDQFLTLLDELLDNTLHDDACYIEPNGTHCVCIIGRIRADLPPCGSVKLHRYPDSAAFGGETMRVWRCQRNAHPASPDRHYFSED